MVSMYFCSQCGHMLMMPSASGRDKENGEYADFDCEMCYSTTRFYAKDEPEFKGGFNEKKDALNNDKPILLLSKRGGIGPEVASKLIEKGYNISSSHTPYTVIEWAVLGDRYDFVVYVNTNETQRAGALADRMSSKTYVKLHDYKREIPEVWNILKEDEQLFVSFPCDYVIDGNCGVERATSRIIKILEER